jgi:hypothetical protein
MDFEGIKTLLQRADVQFPRLEHLWLDSAYNRGEDKGKDWVEEGPRMERGAPRASAKARPRRGPEVVVGQRVVGQREGVKVDWENLCWRLKASQDVTEAGWVVERTFSLG